MAVALRTGAVRVGPDVPAPESVPPVDNPDPRPNDPKPKAPPAEDETGRPVVPVDLPGQPHAPERVTLRGG